MIHTLQSTDKIKFENKVNLLVKNGWILLKDGYKIIENDGEIIYSQVVTLDKENCDAEFNRDGNIIWYMFSDKGQMFHYKVVEYNDHPEDWFIEECIILDKCGEDFRDCNNAEIKEYLLSDKSCLPAFDQTPVKNGCFYGYNFGKISDLFTFRDGKKNGLTKMWIVNMYTKDWPNPSGHVLAWVGNYKDDKQDGLFTYFFGDGVTKSAKVNYKNDVCHGSHIQYYANGQIERKRTYEYGKQIGEHYHYNEDGSLKEFKEY